MDTKKGRKPAGQAKAPTRPATVGTRTDAYADITRGKDC
ncbi:hypothetical protein Gdia_2679 [Gluconacetobacter diazotrophicus PA1 5]|nr:hypothetical protein Gdia_2679 [Gluconacetobacter diazotrophicus PA1 5]TWA98072.1 hypothetical protein FBZ86_1671 [Gluconacetobacter diazotrophicus]